MWCPICDVVELERKEESSNNNNDKESESAEK